METMLVETVQTGLSTSDWIQIISAAATFIISVISVIIAVIAIRQTKKATETAANDLHETTRGNVGISYDMIQHSKSKPVGYILVKNYGAAPLRFEQFDYDQALLDNNQNQNKDAFKTQFDRMKNVTLAPGQAIRIMFIEKNTSAHDYRFTFRYKTSGRYYDDEVYINVAAITGILKGKLITKDYEESQAVILAEIAERMM